MNFLALALAPLKCVAAKQTKKHNTERKNRCSTFNINALGLYANWVACLQQFMIKLFVRRVLVWVDFCITLPFTPYLDVHGTTGLIL